jgi:hypothetical protein
MAKYCCEGFEIKIRTPSTTAPNIRVVKFLPNKFWGEGRFFGFFLTMGYEKFSVELPMMNIAYCPYCGCKLKEHYSSEEYANEIEGETFNTLLS